MKRATNCSMGHKQFPEALKLCGADNYWNDYDALKEEDSDCNAPPNGENCDN